MKRIVKESDDITMTFKDYEFDDWAEKQAEKAGYDGNWEEDNKTWEFAWDELNLWSKWNVKYSNDGETVYVTRKTHKNNSGEPTMKESKTKRTIKEYVEPKTFEDKALFDDFKDSIGGRCFNKDSVYRWVYKLTDIKPTTEEVYKIMDGWVKSKWAYKKQNEQTGADFYYFDLKETVNERKRI